MSSRRLELARSGSIRIVRLLDRVGQLGPVAGLADEIDDACAGIDGDDEARTVVLAFQGVAVEEPVRPEPTGRSAVAGDAPGAVDRDAADAEEGSRIVERLARVQAPVVAAIADGACGFALELALACDLRVAAAGARFALPQVALGRIPSAGGTQRLPRLVGRGRALEMILAGTVVDADEARRIGLVHRVVGADLVRSEAESLAAKIAEAAPVALRYAKEALYAGQDLTLDQGMRLELDLYLLLFSTGDREEGIRAFREKRKPRFTGS